MAQGKIRRLQGQPGSEARPQGMKPDEDDCFDRTTRLPAEAANRNDFSAVGIIGMQTVRGERRTPSFNCRSEATRSSPHVGFSFAISAISFWDSAGTGGRPRGFDFHLPNSHKPFQCHRMKVSGSTMVRASRHANRLECTTSENRVASLARRGLTLRSKCRANSLRRKKFSPAKTQRDHRVSPMNLRSSSDRSKAVSSRLERESSFGLHERATYLGRHLTL
jgi:hypothetical protein